MTLQWKVQTAQLIREIIEHNSNMWILRMPLLIFRRLLVQVAERAIAIDDPELNILMLRLGLYEVHPLDVDKAIENQKRRITA
jgi:hypothetical protein